MKKAYTDNGLNVLIAEIDTLITHLVSVFHAKFYIIFFFTVENPQGDSLFHSLPTCKVVVFFLLLVSSTHNFLGEKIIVSFLILISNLSLKAKQCKFGLILIWFISVLFRGYFSLDNLRESNTFLSWKMCMCS